MLQGMLVSGRRGHGSSFKRAFFAGPVLAKFGKFCEIHVTVTGPIPGISNEYTDGGQGMPARRLVVPAHRRGSTPRLSA